MIPAIPCRKLKVCFPGFTSIKFTAWPARSFIGWTPLGEAFSFASPCCFSECKCLRALVRIATLRIRSAAEFMESAIGSDIRGQSFFAYQHTQRDSGPVGQKCSPFVKMLKSSLHHRRSLGSASKLRSGRLETFLRFSSHCDL